MFRKFNLGVYYGLGFGSRLRVEGSGWVFGVEGLGVWLLVYVQSSEPIFSACDFADCLVMGPRFTSVAQLAS